MGVANCDYSALAQFNDMQGGTVDLHNSTPYHYHPIASFAIFPISGLMISNKHCTWQCVIAVTVTVATMEAVIPFQRGLSRKWDQLRIGSNYTYGTWKKKLPCDGYGYGHIRRNVQIELRA